MSGEALTAAVTLYPGDCLEVLKTLAPDSVDACVCDPPYGLNFMGKAWDHGVPGVPYWKAVFRVLKPGAHLISFGGTRTFGRMHVAIEDAGFEVRDMISWLYGSGFPKSLDVSKAIDRAAGAEREIVGRKADPRYLSPSDAASGSPMGNISPRVNGGTNYERAGFVTAPATYESEQWSGFGTALKPACEPIVLARKPLSEGTVAANVLKWGTGALNIDRCRVATDAPRPGRSNERSASGLTGEGGAVTYGKYAVRGSIAVDDTTQGRWPANVIHDGSDEVVGAFPESAGQQGLVKGTEPSECHNGVYSGLRSRQGIEYAPRNDSGSAARFFYTAKADAMDRLGSKHPTVKPLDLMQYLCRLVCPPKGIVLDPFSGTGTTGEAAIREGFRAVLIEREAEYCDDIRRRMKLAMCGPDERQREAIKAKLKDKPLDHGPLFRAGFDAPPATQISGPQQQVLRRTSRRTIGPIGLKW